jgi:predicted dehydrogenase
MYTVGVIGLGHIAAMYETPASKNPYCHVGGIRNSANVRLAAVADMSAEARQRFRSVWGSAFPDSLRYHDSAAAMLAAEPLDVVAVCVRGPHHYDVTMQVIEAGPRAIFLEKPPSCSLAEMDSMVAAAQTKGISITVSYSRHWSPKVLRVQQLVQQGVIGQVKSVVAYTGHSVLSFGIHSTDLLCQFAGYCPSAVYATGRPGSGDVRNGNVPTGYEPEPNLDGMVVEFENGVTGMQVGSDGEHGGFYCDVYGSEGSARAGIYTEPVIRNAKREPFDLAQFNIPPEQSVFTVAYDQIAACLDGGPKPHCTDGDFTQVNELGFAAVESILTHQRVTIPNQNRTRKIYANG